jgi:hypothetical protein
MEDIKQASNFELNRLKIGKHDFQLEVGDIFWTNGAVFLYEPKGDNLLKLPYRDWHRDKTISCKKHKKDILRADNIELVFQDKRIKRWEVKYVYQQPAIADRLEDVMVLVLSDKSYLRSEVYLRSRILKVERETKNTLFFQDHHPVSYHSKFDKQSLNVAITDRGDVSIVFYGDDYQQAYDTLFAAYEKLLMQRLQAAENKVLEVQQVIQSFNKLK